MTAFWAALPILVALGGLMIRLTAARAAALALAAAVAVAIMLFDAPPAHLLHAGIAIGDVMVEVALILFGGLLLNGLMQQADAQARIGQALIERTASPDRALILIVLGVIPFAESVTGFGVGAIIGIPLLRQIGLTPRRAAVCGLLGLVIVPWGSLGPGTLVAARLAGVDYQALGTTSALLSGVVFCVMSGAALGFGLGRTALWRGLPCLAATMISLWASVWLVNRYLGTPLAGVLGSLVAILVALTFAGFAGRDSRSTTPWPTTALRPYLLLIGGLLITHFLPVFGQSSPWQPIVASPATWLLITAAATPWLLRAGRLPNTTVLLNAFAQWRPVAIATVLFLALGVVLSASHMTATLADTGARLGDAYPAVAPWIGALGGFLTGSNTGASAMFAASQAQTAAAIGYPLLTMVGLQNVSASLATMAALPRIAVAATVATATNADPVAAAHPSIAAVFWPIAITDAIALGGLSIIGALMF